MVLKKKFLGDLLIEAGVITKEQRNKAIQEHKRLGKRLGEALVSLGFIAEDGSQSVGSDTKIDIISQ